MRKVMKVSTKAPNGVEQRWGEIGVRNEEWGEFNKNYMYTDLLYSELHSPNYDSKPNRVSLLQKSILSHFTPW